MSNIDVPSPCINLCKIDEATQLCIGCSRSIDEITRWSSMDNDTRLAVINDLPRRLKLRNTDTTDANPSNNINTDGNQPDNNQATD